MLYFFFFFKAEDGIRDYKVTGFQTCALPVLVLHVRDSLRHRYHSTRRWLSFCRCGDTSAVAVNLTFAGSNRHDRSNRTGAPRCLANGSNCLLQAIRVDTVKTLARWSGLDSFGRGDNMRSWSITFEVDRRLQVDNERRRRGCSRPPTLPRPSVRPRSPSLFSPPSTPAADQRTPSRCVGVRPQPDHSVVGNPHRGESGHANTAPNHWGSDVCFRGVR